MRDTNRPRLSVRSLAEASLWAQFDPCECGGRGVDWQPSRFASAGPDTMTVELESACAGCGTVRALTFDVPGEAQPPQHHFARPHDGPSTLYDPGEWLAFAQRYDAEAAGLLARGGGSRVLGFLTQAATATEEALRFIPVGADRIPETEFFADASREVAQARPELFTRAAIEAERAARWARCIEFGQRHEDPGAPEPAAAVPYPVSRTAEEQLLYLRLHPCVCGQPDFDPVIGIDETEDGTPLSRYAGRCIECGRDREFVFVEPMDMPLPHDESWAPGSNPSRLIDPGEWWLVAQAMTQELPDDDDPDTPPAERRSTLLRCAATVAETIKFLPDGADAVPEAAFTSARGRWARTSSPHVFERDYLEVRHRFLVDQAAAIR